MSPSQLTLIRRRKKKQTELLLTIMVVINVATILYFVVCMMGMTIQKIERPRYTEDEKRCLRRRHLYTLIKHSDIICKSELRVNRQTFYVLCEMVRDIGELSGSRNMSLEEIVAMFLYTLAHHFKNRTIGNHFFRSGESVSRNFHRCLLAILKLHEYLLKKPMPITEECEDNRWKCFENCLGALDGTYINVQVPNEDRARYRTRKGFLAMNVLGVCNSMMEFIYVQPGWEGSAHDGRVLRDAISRPYGLHVPQGFYYLVDAGYTNCQGFLAPYRGHRYHLKEKYMIKCERQSYDDFCRQNKNAHGLWNVPFPHYDKLAIIYGPDRANGTNSETFTQAIENQQNEAIDLSRDESDEDGDVDVIDSLNQSTQSSPIEPASKKAKTMKTPTDNKKQKRMRRKMPEVVDLTTFKDMSSNLSSFMNGMNAHMSTIANALSTTQQHEQAIMVREQELEDQKKNLINELLGVQGLTRYEALLAAQKLASSPSDLSLFYQSPDEAWKREFIINLIHPHLPRNGNI